MQLGRGAVLPPGAGGRRAGVASARVRSSTPEGSAVRAPPLTGDRRVLTLLIGSLDPWILGSSECSSGLRLLRRVAKGGSMDRWIAFSADGHVGCSVETMRPYVDPAYRDNLGQVRVEEQLTQEALRFIRAEDLPPGDCRRRRRSVPAARWCLRTCTKDWSPDWLSRTRKAWQARSSCQAGSVRTPGSRTSTQLLAGRRREGFQQVGRGLHRRGRRPGPRLSGHWVGPGHRGRPGGASLGG